MSEGLDLDILSTTRYCKSSTLHNFDGANEIMSVITDRYQSNSTAAKESLWQLASNHSLMGQCDNS